MEVISSYEYLKPFSLTEELDSENILELTKEYKVFNKYSPFRTEGQTKLEPRHHFNCALAWQTPGPERPVPVQVTCFPTLYKSFVSCLLILT